MQEDKSSRAWKAFIRCKWLRAHTDLGMVNENKSQKLLQVDPKKIE